MNRVAERAPTAGAHVDGVNLAGAGGVDRSGWGRALGEQGARSVRERTMEHRRLLETTGVGRYYGSQSSFKAMSTPERARWLAQNLAPGASAPTLRESNCIAWAFEHIGAAYRAVGAEARWNQILSRVVARGSKGTDLALELKKDGWQTVYFNPDLRQPRGGDPEHSASARQVARTGLYYGVPVDFVLEDYSPSHRAPSPAGAQAYARLRSAPFFFGLEHGGVHTFVGVGDTMSEFHWRAMPNQRSAMEERPFREHRAGSGLLVLPPGTWPPTEHLAAPAPGTRTSGTTTAR